MPKPWANRAGAPSAARRSGFWAQTVPAKPRWAKVWHKGRCAIGGDAAHLMPPFAGEGMCAGLRDAFALGWRLNAILDGKVGVDVLESYTSERIEHAKHYINFSQDLGKIICISDPKVAADRDRSMKADLAARNFTPVPTDLCQLGPGAWCADTAHAGELSVQGVVEAKGKRDRFDQAVGFGWMVLGLDADPAKALTAEQNAALAFLGGQSVRVGAAGSGADAVDANGNLQNGVVDDLQIQTASQEPRATESILQTFNVNSTNVRPTVTNSRSNARS